LNTKDFILVLQEGYKEKCEKCSKKYTSIDDDWCRSCHTIYLNKLFKNLTSGNDNIDILIERWRNHLKDYLFEFIPYNQFDNIKKISGDNYAMATWKDGPLNYYNKKWSRELNKNVYLKLLDATNADEFLYQV
jgi:hypothetical protein